MVYWIPSKETFFQLLAFQKKEREKVAKSLFKEIMAENFPNLGRDTQSKFMKLIVNFSAET